MTWSAVHHNVFHRSVIINYPAALTTLDDGVHVSNWNDKTLSRKTTLGETQCSALLKSRCQNDKLSSAGFNDQASDWWEGGRMKTKVTCR